MNLSAWISLIQNAWSRTEIEHVRQMIADRMEAGQCDWNDDQLDLISVAIEERRGLMHGWAA